MNREEHLKKNAGRMTTELIATIVSQESAEIRFEFEHNEQWAVLTTYDDTDDTELSLRLHSQDRFLLYMGYYDDKDEFFEAIQPLSAEEAATIPAGLQKLMAKVLDDEQGMRVPGSLLAKLK